MTLAAVLLQLGQFNWFSSPPTAGAFAVVMALNAIVFGLYFLKRPLDGRPSTFMDYVVQAGKPLFVQLIMLCANLQLGLGALEASYNSDRAPMVDAWQLHMAGLCGAISATASVHYANRCACLATSISSKNFTEWLFGVALFGWNVPWLIYSCLELLKFMSPDPRGMAQEMLLAVYTMLIAWSFVGPVFFVISAPSLAVHRRWYPRPVHEHAD